MLANLRACVWLLVLTVILCCGVYPAVLLALGQTLFHNKAEGSLIFDKNGKPIGSRLIAQPFNGEQFFYPRPSAASFNAAASGASNWGGNNYLLRDRVARQLGPIVKYRSGPKQGQLVGPDIEVWFHKDHYQGQPGIVAQWASAHSTLASNWAKSDPLNAAYVAAWQETHTDSVGQWKKDNPTISEPKPEDLAGVFFSDFSKEHPGMFPVATVSEGTTDKRIEPTSKGADIQSIFFDMWRHEHADVDLQPVPADMVMASGSGLDPHITLKNAEYQLDRVAAKWAELKNLDITKVRKEIEEIVRKKKEAPLGGLVGVDMINVLETNLELKQHFETK